MHSGARPLAPLTTRGRRTGPCGTALYYGRNGGRYVRVATAARGSGDPTRYRNLLESPPVVLQVRTEVLAAVARPEDARERSRLWELMVARIPEYAAYEREAGRRLPIVVAEPWVMRG
jgi:deazaflavin-dependent oxidoreductase (nitroreductase family)